MAVLVSRRWQQRDADLTALAASGLAAGWTAYTPTVTAQAGAITSYTINKAAYLVIGKLAFDHVDFTITNAGTGATGILVSNPPSVPGTGRNYPIFGREMINTGKGLAGYMAPAQKFVYFYDNSYPGAVNNRLVVTTVYEVA